MRKNCRDCKHFFDLMPLTNTHGLECGPYLCRAPQLRDYMAVTYDHGKRHQNSGINAASARSVRTLCSLDATWFEPVNP
jgi:hypothetical protein